MTGRKNLYNIYKIKVKQRPVMHADIYISWISGPISIRSVVYKDTYNLIFFPTPIFKFLDFLPQILSPLPLFPTRQSSLQPKYYRTDDITSPYPFFFPKAPKLPSPLHNLNFNNFPPPRGGGEELYTLLYQVQP